MYAIVRSTGRQSDKKPPNLTQTLKFLNAALPSLLGVFGVANMRLNSSLARTSTSHKGQFELKLQSATTHLICCRRPPKPEDIFCREFKALSDDMSFVPFDRFDKNTPQMVSSFFEISKCDEMNTIWKSFQLSLRIDAAEPHLAPPPFSARRSQIRTDRTVSCFSRNLPFGFWKLDLF